MNANGDIKSLYRVAVLAACVAAAALLIGGVALAMSSGATTASADQRLVLINQKLLIFTVGSVAIILVSLFDMFTVPGLVAALWKNSRALTGMAAISAIVRDLLGVTGGLIQATLIPLSRALVSASSASVQTVIFLESTFTTAGFLLVGVSFLLFGFSILRGTFGKWIGWVAIAAGVFSILGQISVLAMLFMLASLAYLLWYIGLATRFSRLTKNA
jgi:hypothetical protein